MGYDFDNAYRTDSIVYIVGTDEAGRGPLAGPLVAAAVIFPPTFQNPLIDDSKKLSDKKRRLLFEIIKKEALAIGISIISADKVDEINVYEASRLAMTEAILKLNHQYDLVLTDCMLLPTINKAPVISLIKGDAKSLTIAAASIIAKVTRDDLMLELDKKYPQYSFKLHKGYGTKLHLEALELYGPLPHIHRYSYAPVKNSLKIKLF